MKKLLPVLLLLCGSIYPQGDASMLRDLLNSDTSSARFLFSYPDTVRREVFTAATYPQGFVKIGEIQRGTSAAFRDLAGKYRKGRQKQLWDIARYPELPGLLLDNTYKENLELSPLLKPYPAETRKAALHFLRHEPAVLAGVDRIRQDFEMKYKAAVADFPASVQQSYTALLNYPDLLMLLTDDGSTTRVLGEVEARDPVLLKHVADSVHRQIAEESGREYEEWKEGIGKDKAMQKELKEVSEKYAREQGEQDGSTDDVYATGTGMRYQKGKEAAVAGMRPYPYWAGYPYWYETPYWYPYPWWYNMGFSWGLGGSMVFFGMPSYSFGWWYYNSDPYYSRYNRTSGYFNNYYSNHPRSGSGINRSIRDYNRGGGGMQRSMPGGGGGAGGGMGGGGGRRR